MYFTIFKMYSYHTINTLRVANCVSKLLSRTKENHGSSDYVSTFEI